MHLLTLNSTKKVTVNNLFMSIFVLTNLRMIMHTNQEWKLKINNQIKIHKNKIFIGL